MRVDLLAQPQDGTPDRFYFIRRDKWNIGYINPGMGGFGSAWTFYQVF